MLPITSLYGDQATAMQALRDGAVQSAEISIYNANATGYPLIKSFHNNDIIADSLNLQKACNSGEEMEIGMGVSDELQVSVYSDASITTLKGQKITLMIEWGSQEDANDGTVYPFSGMITEIARVRDGVYSIVALDALCVFDRPLVWSQLIDPNSPADPYFSAMPRILDLFWSICITYGAPFVDTGGITFPTPRSSIPNADIRINGSKIDQRYNCRQVMKWCAQAMGMNFRVGHDRGHRVELYYPTATPSTAENATEMYYSIAAGDVPQSGNGSRYRLSITEGETVEWQGSSSYMRSIVISDNAVLREAQGYEISGVAQTYDVTGARIQSKITSVIPAETTDFSGTGVPQWWIEPWDILMYQVTNDTYRVAVDTTVQAGVTYYTTTDGETYTAVTPASGDNPVEKGWYVKFPARTVLLMVTSVTHKLNGSSQVEAKVPPISDDEVVAMPFNAGQQQVLDEAFDDVNEDVGNLQTGLNTANGNITSLQNAITNLNNALFYKAGDTIDNWTTDTGLFHCYGYVYSGGASQPRYMRLVVPLKKIVPDGLSATITQVRFATLCSSAGDLIEAQDFEAISYLASGSTAYFGSVMQIRLNKTAGWKYVTRDSSGNPTGTAMLPHDSVVSGFIRLKLSFTST